MTSIPLIGYADALSVAPGERIAFKVSSTLDDPYEARLVQVVSGDPNPDGPGLIEREVEADFAGRHPSRFQPTFPGSYVRIAAPRVLDDLASFSAVAIIWPTTPDQGPQAVLGRWRDDESLGFGLAIGPRGAVALVGDGARRIELPVGKPLVGRRWYRVWCRFDAAAGELEVGQAPLIARADADDAGTARIDTEVRPGRAGDLLLAAFGDAIATHHYNGKIERPVLANAALDTDAIAAIVAGAAGAAGAANDAIVAAWDFSQGIDGPEIVDVGPHGLHGRLVNLPTRAVTSSAWDGSEFRWRDRPAHYAAIHFHDDDMHDCGWQTDFSFTVPDAMKSGVYAARLAGADGAEDMIPFFVRAAPGRPQARVCVLIPTFTYIVYANFARGNADDRYWARVADWGARPWHPDVHRAFGLSTYNFHSDGSGVAYSSRLRPILTMRSGFLSYANMPGSGLRHFPADGHLWTWLEQMDIAFDVVTDEDLHRDGLAAIAGYRAVLTTSHPEYHTPNTLGALQGYVDGGGRFMYLGGNGFYWKVAVNDAFPGAVEIRRGETGIRAWAAEPGEYYNSFDGSYGGLWRRNGRPPQRLAGVGFTAQGNHEGSYYRRAPASHAPEVAWIFDGIEDEVIGGFGLSGGGAAGFELDRADPRLGTPRNAVVLATSEKHQDHFVLVPEDILTHLGNWNGEATEDLIRSDMVYFETANGGAVFSVGSITYCGSLPCNGGDNDISRLTGNVLRRFMAD